jgi:hypothetical protein
MQPQPYVELRGRRELDAAHRCANCLSSVTVLTTDGGVFGLQIMSYVTGETDITATAVLNGETLITGPLRILWVLVFDSITLAPGRQRVSLDRRARMTATVEYTIGSITAGIPGVTVTFKVSWVPSSQDSTQLAATSKATPATVLPITKRLTTNAEGKAVLLLDNPKHHTPGTYRVVASATTDTGNLVQSNHVLVTWWGRPEGEHQHYGDYSHREREHDFR